jgi:hypothetical protein
MDLEDAGALQRFDAAALQRFLQRWFTVAERSWCVAQPDLARALVVGISCKEAAHKSIGAPDLLPDQIQIDMAGEGVITSARLHGTHAISRSRLVWTAAGSAILALAVDSGVDPGVLRQLLQLGRSAVLRNRGLAE